MRYWDERKHLEYYRVAVSMVIGESVLDVGAGTQHGCEYLNWLGQNVTMRHTIERGPDRGIRLPGVVHHFRDFAAWDVPRQYDTVLCLQTLEHVEDPRAFAGKLLSLAAQRVVVSIPYRWTAGSKSHRNLDGSTICEWFGRCPTGRKVSDRRLLCWFDV